MLPYCHPPGTEGDQEGSRCSGCCTLLPSALLGWKYRGVRAPPPGGGVTRAAPQGGGSKACSILASRAPQQVLNLSSPAVTWLKIHPFLWPSGPHLTAHTFLWLLPGLASQILIPWHSNPCVRIFMVSRLMFKSLILFESIFVYGVRYGSNFILLHGDNWFSQHHLLKRLFLPHWVFLVPLSKIG